MRKSDHTILRSLLISGVISADGLTLALSRKALAQKIGLREDQLAEDICSFEVPFKMRRRGVEAKLIIGKRAPKPDPVLCKALFEAHNWTRALQDGVPLKELSRREDSHPTYISNRAQLAFLSPRIQIAIAKGNHAVGLTLEKLIRTPIPFDWNDQERRHGF